MGAHVASGGKTEALVDPQNPPCQLAAGAIGERKPEEMVYGGHSTSPSLPITRKRESASFLSRLFVPRFSVSRLGQRPLCAWELLHARWATGSGQPAPEGESWDVGLNK